MPARETHALCENLSVVPSVLLTQKHLLPKSGLRTLKSLMPVPILSAASGWSARGSAQHRRIARAHPVADVILLEHRAEECARFGLRVKVRVPVAHRFLDVHPIVPVQVGAALADAPSSPVNRRSRVSRTMMTGKSIAHS